MTNRVATIKTVFSMTFFNWQEDTESMLSPYIWIFVAVTFVLTALTMALWRFWVVTAGARKDKQSMSMA